jgi:DNA repair exonuclease SbcCD nuclease subunit
MKIFAFADLHLDSAFSSYPENERAERKEILMQVFNKICNECRTEKADLLLIAGDLFDTPTPSPSCSDFVISEFKALGINVVIAPGNHDYYIPDGIYDKMPDNVYVFKKEELSTISINELSLSIDGFAYLSDNHAPLIEKSENASESDNVRILLAHSDINSKSTPYAYISKEYFSASDYIFSFLGHVHTDTGVYSAGNVQYGYSGVPQGRSIDEPIDGGIREIEIKNGSIVSNDIVSVSEWKNLVFEIPIDNAVSDYEVIRNISDVISVSGIEKMDILRIILVGEHGFYYTPNESFILKQTKKLLSNVNVSLKNNSVPQIDRDELLSDPSIIGVLYRTLFENEEYVEKYTVDQRTRAFRLALSAMRGDQLNYENI